MFDIQVVVNNESINSLKNNQVQATLAGLKEENQNLVHTWESKHSDLILCCYVNTTSKIQIARIENIANWLERVVFPGQRLLFEALPNAQLEIYTGMIATAILLDKIQCECLRVFPK